MTEYRWSDPPEFMDEWIARQVIRFHERGDVPCAGCSQGLVCQRLTRARTIVGSTTDASAGIHDGPTVRP